MVSKVLWMSGKLSSWYNEHDFKRKKSFLKKYEVYLFAMLSLDKIRSHFSLMIGRNDIDITFF